CIRALRVPQCSFRTKVSGTLPPTLFADQAATLFNSQASCETFDSPLCTLLSMPISASAVDAACTSIELVVPVVLLSITTTPPVSPAMRSTRATAPVNVALIVVTASSGVSSPPANVIVCGAPPSTLIKRLRPAIPSVENQSERTEPFVAPLPCASYPPSSVTSPVPFVVTLNGVNF